ncbi:hypothetical protein N431DRAFT_323820 [Stipitochalara longipes BDJ]|nr:hypothetical protein N431DRAFT_323820 [Stipitochalara longipes BDJ]
MSINSISPIKKAWYRWKSFKLPWRKRFLVGLDLQGNTFWEFRDTLSSHTSRMRRIVQYPASTHYSDIKISPQWHQWLRHTRSNPPSLTEQSQDVIRRQNLKVLAAEADARWAAKPSFLDSPGQARTQPLSALEVKDPGSTSESESRVGTRNPIKGEPESITKAADISADNRGMGEQEEEIHMPDGIRRHFNESLGQDERSRTDSNKDKADPWNQSRGSDKWQPAAWDGNIASLRR